MSRPIVCWLLMLLQVGCAGRKPNTWEPVSRAYPEIPATIFPAPADGTYHLRTSPDDPKVSSNSVLIERKLRKGDPLGFAQDAMGSLQAVAGKERIELASGFSYEWCQEVIVDGKSTTRRIFETTLIVTGTIAVMITVGVGLLALSLVDPNH